MPKVQKKIVRTVLLVCLSVTSVSCSSFFAKDNTPPPNPLTFYKPEIRPKQLWGVYTGGSSTKDYLKLAIATSPTAVFVSSTDGVVTSLNKFNGYINWRIGTGLSLTTGPTYADGILVVGSRKGIVEALSSTTGAVLWSKTLPGAVLAQPAISEGVVVVKTTEGGVYGLSPATGEERWYYQETEPNLILHSASKPLIQNNRVYVGFANGNLDKLNLSNGNLVWQRPLAKAEGAFPISRMVDIDADPVIYDENVFAATYQGTITALDFSGRTQWSHDLSSYTGMAADGSGVYVSDANSMIWSFNDDTGTVNWQQTDLAYRRASGPSLMGPYIVVGDEEGYLHWLSKRDGHLAGRVFLGSSIFAPPKVENKVVYAYTKNGYLVAYRLA